MRIEWSDDYKIWTRRHYIKGGTPGKGVIVAPTAPFKGICSECGKRTTVRHYPWSLVKWFGTFCKPCIDRIDSELAEPDHIEPEY